MKVLAAALFAALPAVAQLTPATMTFHMHYQGESPYVQSTTVTTGTPSNGGCVDTQLTGLCAAMRTAVNGQVVSVFWTGNAVFALGTPTSNSVYKANLTINGGGTCPCTLAITFNNYGVQPPAATHLPAFLSTNNLFSGWSNSNASLYLGELDTSPFPSNWPPGGTFQPLPALNSTWIDQATGTLIRRISPVNSQRTVCGDAISTQITYDEKMICTSDANGGAIFLTNIDGSGDAFTVPAGDRDNLLIDPKGPYIYYTPPVTQGTNVAQVKRASWSDSFATPTVIYTYPGVADQLSNSNDEGINKDGWIAYMPKTSTSGNDAVLILLNVFTSQAFTISYAGIASLGTAHLPGQADQLRNTIQTSKGFGADNKLYMIVGVYSNHSSSNEIFSYTKGSGAIVDEGAQPIRSEAANNNGGSPGPLKIIPTSVADCALGWCHYSVHEDSFEALFNSSFHEFFFESLGPPNSSIDIPTVEDVTVGGVIQMHQAVEGGGGQYALNAFDHATADTHGGCAAFAPVCIYDTDSDPQVTAYVITAVAVGTPPTLTIGAGTAGLSNGNTLLMSPVAGVVGLNTVNTACIIQNLTGTTLQCNGLTTSGAWTGATSASPASFTVATLPATQPHQAMTVFYDFTNIGTYQTRMTSLYKHGSWNYNDRYSAQYYGQPHSVISPYGDIACSGGNGGTPDNLFVVCYSTGYPTRVSAAAVGAGAVGAVQ